MLPLQTRAARVSRRLYHSAVRRIAARRLREAMTEQDRLVASENGWCMRTRRTAPAALALTCMCCFAIVLVPRAGGSAATLSVGVVEFYAPTPLGAFPGVAMEPFAADDLSRLLARSASGRLAVIPAATMRRAEADLHWHTVDALHFDRLRSLAQAVGANRLVVGWIPLFSVDGSGGRSIPVPDDGNGPPTADANIVVQVFDPGEGRLIGETRQYGSALGLTRWQVATGALHAALERSIPDLLRLLGARTF